MQSPIPLLIISTTLILFGHATRKSDTFKPVKKAQIDQSGNSSTKSLVTITLKSTNSNNSISGPATVFPLGGLRKRYPVYSLAELRATCGAAGLCGHRCCKVYNPKQQQPVPLPPPPPPAPAAINIYVCCSPHQIPPQPPPFYQLPLRYPPFQYSPPSAVAPPSLTVDQHRPHQVYCPPVCMPTCLPSCLARPIPPSPHNSYPTNTATSQPPPYAHQTPPSTPPPPPSQNIYQPNYPPLPYYLSEAPQAPQAPPPSVTSSPASTTSPSLIEPYVYPMSNYTPAPTPAPSAPPPTFPPMHPPPPISSMNTHPAYPPMYPYPYYQPELSAPTFYHPPPPPPPSPTDTTCAPGYTRCSDRYCCRIYKKNKKQAATKTAT